MAKDIIDGNASAIAKLIKEKNIDIYDFDKEENQDYKPTATPVSPQEAAIQDVLESIEHSPVYADTIGFLGSIDERSKNVIAGSPELIHVLNEHKETGMFNTIWDEVVRQRALGGLGNRSDIEAYYEVGNMLFGQQQNNQQQIPASNLNQANYTQNSQTNSNNNNRRDRVVKGSKQLNAQAATSENNLDTLANMSDEDFLKQLNF